MECFPQRNDSRLHGALAVTVKLTAPVIEHLGSLEARPSSTGKLISFLFAKTSEIFNRHKKLSGKLDSLAY